MSKPNLKPIDQQVIVITGASSGIGLATALLALERGARVVLAARSEETGLHLVEEISAAGAEALFFQCDVSNRQQVEELVEAAIDTYGQIDTWVNNAGISIYGRLDEVDEEDSRRLFDTNFWGVVNGSLAVLPYLVRTGGALINVGSEVSEAIVPYQGMYSASKHAVKGFTDALRVEIEELDGAPVSITLIQPTATDTPYPQHAKNYRSQEPKLPDPLDEPQHVAEAILHAAVTPTRSKKVGLMSKVNTTVANIIPSLGDKMAARMAAQQHYSEAPRNPGGALHIASELAGGAGNIHGSGGIPPRSR